MRSNLIKVAGMMLGAAAILLLAGQAMPFGGFSKPPVPPGAHLQGPAGKGTITYLVSSGVATIQFDGTCNNQAVKTNPLDVSAITSFSAFPEATAQAVANTIEGFFTDNPVALDPFQVCYNHTALGIYVTAVNKSVLKNNTMWVGEVTVQGVR